MSAAKSQRRVNIENVECSNNASTSRTKNGIIDWMGDDSDETALLAHHYQICDVLEK